MWQGFIVAGAIGMMFGAVCAAVDGLIRLAQSAGADVSLEVATTGVPFGADETPTFYRYHTASIACESMEGHQILWGCIAAAVQARRPDWIYRQVGDANGLCCFYEGGFANLSTQIFCLRQVIAKCLTSIPINNRPPICSMENMW